MNKSSHRLLRAVTIGVLLAGVYRAMTLPLNHDVAWPLHLATRVLAGDRLYVDLIEVNPPLIIWLGLPTVLLEQILGLARTLVYPAVVAILATATVWLSIRLSRRSLTETESAVFACVLAVAILVLPGASFNEREHVFTILTLPYVIVTALRVSGVRPRGAWLSAVPAGIGFCIKPHFVLVFLALETWSLVKRVGPWVGTWVVIAIGGAYACALLTLTPEYVPMMLRIGAAYASSNHIPLSELLVKPRAFVPMLSLVNVVPGGSTANLRRTLGVFVGASVLIALVQGKDFFYPYHFYPALAGALLLWILGLIAISKGRWIPRSAFVGAAAVGIIAIGDVVVRPGSRHGQWLEIEAFRTVARGERALVLSKRQGDAWPAVTYAEIAWSFKMPCFWAAGTTPYADSLTTRLAIQALAERPKLVFVTTNSVDNPLPDLLRHDDFRRAWSDYIATDTVLHYQVFRPASALAAVSGAPPEPDL